MAGKTDLSTFTNKEYQPGPVLKRISWYLISVVFFESAFPMMGIKCFLLRLFGAKVGIGLIIKPRVTIKYPWKLCVGHHVWIGEKVWIDNLGQVILGDHCCLSQGAMLLCGNHNYKKATFDLMVGDITIGQGAWVGARAIVCPGVTLAQHSVLTVGSVATDHLEPYFIYQGNPAEKIKPRKIAE